MVRSRAFFFAATFLAIADTANATPKPLPFTYGTDTNPKGQGEVEQYVDLVPIRATDPQGKTVPYLATQLQTEVEYGISNRVELGLYLTLAPQDSSFTNVAPLTEGNGSKQRVRWRLADQGDWPIDVALYGEISETNTEIELEGKIILEKRFGPVRILANAWVEYEFYYSGRRDIVFNPTAGITVQATPHVSPGIEYWMRAEIETDVSNPPTSFNQGPHHYVGPALRLSFGNFFWTTGLYMRVSNFGRLLDVGDSYGPIWFRSLVGFSF